ncbi:MAG: phage baseplate assembly protein [Cloacibacillus sp.]
MNDTINVIKKLTRPVAQKAALASARCIIKLVNDSVPLQSVQIDALAGETRSDVERVQEYGFTSMPQADCRGIAIFIGGDRSSGVVIATDDTRYRKKDLLPGEVAIYTDEGDYIHFKRGKEIEIVTGCKLIVTAPQTEITGDISILGNVTVSGDVVASGKSLVNHIHTCPHGGNTSEPN